MFHQMEEMKEVNFAARSFNRQFGGKRLVYRLAVSESRSFYTERIIVVVNGSVTSDQTRTCVKGSDALVKCIMSPSFVGCCVWGLGLTKKGYQIISKVEVR